MFKQIQNYINFLIVCLAVSNFSFSQIEGCTDPLAYNCEDSMAGDYVNYVGITLYDYSCDGTTQAGTEDCALGEICEGYYDPAAETDDGSCYYPQAPHDYEVVFNINVTADVIQIDWSAFDPPDSGPASVVVSYYVQRCVGVGCIWIEGFDPTQGDINTETFVSDNYEFEIGVEIKYAIAVLYPNNPYWGWAIMDSYIIPPGLGNVNGDSVWNVLDIVALANCVLTSTCDEMEFSYACDMNGDGTWNVLDIVALANCVLTSNCG